MRYITLEVLEERKTKVLSAVVHYYVKTGKPVGSDVLIEKYGFTFSSSGIRNIMSLLEKEGYLAHTHTSSGRIPTDKGYRFYVDSLIKLQNFAIEEEKKIREEYKQKYEKIESLLSETSRILSSLSKYTGFVMAPKTKCDKIKNIELVQINNENVLIILLLTQSGIIKHNTINASLNKKQINILKIFLNEKLRGVSIADANRKIVLEIKKMKQDEEEILKVAENISDIFYNIQDNVYIDYTSNVIPIMNFNDFNPLKSLMKFNEDKKKFIKIINKNFNDKGISVKIGSENIFEELKDLSMVTTVYKNNNRAVGILGIIGPKRMEYQKIISIVKNVSKILNKFFKNKNI
ncbi:MAG: heat-inducible transcriptional repressor HrcA [Endomicrobium sp.]|jgi:heat-inducible transcriptional repressor|nr:heat-inducible transcriptional repressor HrcA [Endomicrobium sp.]